MSFKEDHKFDYNNVWEVIHAYLKKDSTLVKHHLESYNDFMRNKIDDIIGDFNPIVIKDKFSKSEEFYEESNYIRIY